MKLFWGSIVFIAVTCFTPLAFGQSNYTYWDPVNTNNTLNSSGAWNQASNWLGGVPNGAADTGSYAVIFPSGIITVGSVLTTTNPVVTVTVPAGQSAQGLEFEGAFDSDYPQLQPGTMNLNIASGATLSLTGNDLGAPFSTPILFVYQGVTANISGGNLALGTGIINVGGGYSGESTNSTLNLTNVNVTIADGSSMLVGFNYYDSTGAVAGVMTQNNTTINAGSDFSLQVGSSDAATAGVGTYAMSNNSSLTTGTNSEIYIANGTFSQDSTSTITLGNGTGIYVAYFGTDSGQFNQAGNLVLNNSTIDIGHESGSVGVYQQTSGNTTGTGALLIGAGGQGTYMLSGGTANFQQGITVGQGGGIGLLNQSGNTSLTAGAGQMVTIGIGGTGTYNFSGGTADFQGGMQIGASGVVNQSGNATFTVEGAGFSSEIDGAFNISGGTANFQGGILLATGATVNQSGGNINAGGINPSEIDGTYSISGGTVAFGSGLNLTGVLNLNGGTVQVQEDLLSNGGGALNLHGGTLKMTSGADSTYLYNFTTDALQGTSTIDVSATAFTGFTFNSALTGNGGISLIGNGSTLFNFATGNDYFGVTSIQSGILNVDQAGITNSSNLNIGTGGVLNLNLTGGFAFAGAGGLSGPGLLNVNYASPGDSLVLVNANNFTGSVVLGANGTQGNLQIYNGTYTDISDNGTDSGVTIGGVPLVSGGPTPPTSGTVILSGANTYTGLTKINPNFTVQASTFAGSVENNGTLATLGTLSSPGSMNIAGDLTSTGKLNVFVNGIISDTYQVQGGSTLSGIVNVKGSGSNQYAVVTETGGGIITIGGNTLLNDAGGLNTNAPTALFSAYLSMDPTSDKLYVNTVQKPLSTFAVTPNQQAVANALDPLTQTPPPSFVPLLTAFNTLSAGQIPIALESLTPEALQYSRNIAFENATFLVQKINGTLADIRGGYSGLDANGLSYSAPGFNSSLAHSLNGMLASNAPSFHTAAPNGVNYYDDGGGTSAPNPGSDYDQPVSHPSRMTPSQAASPTTYDGQVLSDSPVPMRTSAPPTLRTSQFTEFVSGDVILADINQNANMPSKASYTAGDITAGVGFRVTSNLTVGVLFDFNHTNAKTDNLGSKTTVDSYSPGVFASYYTGDFFANGLFSFGWNQYSNDRNVPIAGGTANSDPNGQQYVTNIDFGYNFHPFKNWVLTPTLGLTYTHLDVDSFSETGAPLADLNVNSQSVDSLRSRLGGQVSYMTRVGNIILQPNFSASWQHEYMDNGPGITSNFQAYGTSPFTIQTAAPTKDSALLGAGLTATLDNSLCFYLNYMADVGGDYLAQSVIGGVKASF